MKTRDVIAASAVVAAALLARGAEAQAVFRDVRTIRVSATGEARMAPDRAWVDFGVETEAATARQASDENARRMDAIIAALVRAGVARADIQTRDYMVFPVHEEGGRPTGGEPRVRGYRVTNTVSAQMDDVRRVGPVIDAALEAGANRVNGVRFGLRNPEAARAAAIRDAIRRARAEAELIAQGLNVTLGPVLDATTSSALPPPYPVPFAGRAEVAMADAANTPIEPGRQTVTAVVSLVYGISPLVGGDD